MKYMLPLISAIALSSCSSSGISPVPSMLAICKEFASAKIAVAQQVNYDATLPANQQRFKYADLVSIKEASDKMTEFCPAPAGYTPLKSTLQISMAMLNILNNYVPDNTAHKGVK